MTGIIINDKVKKILIDVLDLPLNVSQIRDETPLYSSVIGLDSSGLLKTIVRIENEFQVTIDDEDIMGADLETVGDLGNLVSSKIL